MKLNKWTVSSVIGASLLVGSLSIGLAMAQGPAPETDQVQESAYKGSVSVDQAQYDNLSETDEAAALQQLASISPDQAKAAAEAANPGATATKVELDNENGVLVYSVELSNSLDVKVDAGDGTILHTEQAGEDNSETPGVEDAAGQ